ncbi:NAD-dependent epimerase/dehydratase family protein [Luxibacter massiliensis]|uniref:NAD-dependent epimerase/dehydratase family protein n=1 Tax=Luxibacter massiliensis TaxID=2219695 RepID=UPI000F05248A|nr:NAD-dependent epimerase/dehydratase family protein [Luxibacter massiliensis]
MKVLITGGAGFIGYHLTRELLDNGYQIVLVDNFSRGVQDNFLKELEENPLITFISADLMQEKDVMDLDKDFDYIYHLAAIIGVQNVLNHPYDVLEKNVQLLFHMIHFAKQQNHLKRFIFASTSEIYAGTLQYYNMEIPTPESTPLTITPLEHPRTSYMLSKIYGEAVLQQSGLPFTIIRPHNFYGPRMGMSHVIPELLKKAYFSKEDQKLEVFSVEHKRTFCYISDAVTMIRMLAESEKGAGKAYNIGNEFPEVSIMEVAETVLKVTGKNIEIDSRPATPGSPSRRCPSMKKTAECIGYKGKVSLAEGIEKTFDWYKTYIFDGKEVSAK